MCVLVKVLEHMVKKRNTNWESEDPGASLDFHLYPA